MLHNCRYVESILLFSIVSLSCSLRISEAQRMNMCCCCVWIVVARVVTFGVWSAENVGSNWKHQQYLLFMCWFHFFRFLSLSLSARLSFSLSLSHLRWLVSISSIHHVRNHFNCLDLKIAANQLMWCARIHFYEFEFECCDVCSDLIYNSSCCDGVTHSFSDRNCVQAVEYMIL